MSLPTINNKWPFAQLEIHETFNAPIERYMSLLNSAQYYRKKQSKRFKVNKISDTECVVTRVE